MLSSIRFVGFVVLVCVSLFGPMANAEEQIFIIDTSQSSLSIGGNLHGNFPSPQAPGSTTTTYQGTIKVDRVGNSIQFINGSVIDAIIKGNYQPEPDGTPGSDPADYGRTADGPPFSFATTLEALRDVQLDLHSDNPITITSGSFDSGQFAIIVDAGESDWSYGTQFGETDLSGKGTANGSGTPSTLMMTDAITETLTLFIGTGEIAYSVATSNDSRLTFGGQLVATRVIPEPGCAMALMILCGAASMRRRR